MYLNGDSHCTVSESNTSSYNSSHHLSSSNGSYKSSGGILQNNTSGFYRVPDKKLHRSHKSYHGNGAKFFIITSVDRNNNLGSPKSKRERKLPKESAGHHQKAETKAPVSQGVFSITTVTSNVTTGHKPDNHRSKQQSNENRRWFTPEKVIRRYGSSLSDYERSEILHYEKIYYFGLGAAKSSGRNEFYNSGFDNKKGEYKTVEHDHIAYRYEVLETIGRGAFGEVVSAYDHKKQRKVALKIIRNRPNENLYEVLNRGNFQGLPVKIIRSVTKCVLKCLAILNEESIIHCDIKPENILLVPGDKVQVKLIDFGSSCRVEEQIYNYIQSRYYRAPEVIMGMRYTTSIDMWSLGCVLAELHTGVPLFPGSNEANQLQCIANLMGEPPEEMILKSSMFSKLADGKKVGFKLATSSEKNFDDEMGSVDSLFKDFVRRCLVWNPEDRMTVEEALKHPWIKYEEFSKGTTEISRKTNPRTQDDESPINLKDLHISSPPDRRLDRQDSGVSIPKIPYSTPNFCIHQPTSNRSDNRRSSFNVPRLPTSLTNKISILLKTILCYCLRGGRSNAATLGRLGAINLLFKALATVSGLSINYSGVSSASDETMNRMAVVEKCTRNGLKMIANFSTVQKVLVTMTAIIKWRHNVTRAVNAGGVSLLLDLLLVLHRCDNERLVNLQLITITALQTITELRAGRCALVAAGGLFSLSTLCASKISAVKQSSSYPASIVSDHFIHQTTCTTINNPPVKQSTSPEATESLDRQWKFSATLSGNSSVSSGNFSGESTPQVHTMSSTSNDSRTGRVSMEICKTPIKIEAKSMKRKVKKKRNDDFSEEYNGVKKLLSKMSCSSEEPSFELHVVGNEIRHTTSAGDLQVDSKKSKTVKQRLVKRFSDLKLAKLKSLQKLTARNPYNKLLRSSNRIKVHERVKDSEDGNVKCEDDDEEENHLEDNDADVADSSCGTPDIQDEIGDIGALATKFGLKELLKSHGRFFPEWKEVPGLGIRIDLPEEENNEKGKEKIFEDMLNEAKQTSSTPDRYLIAARNVYSALDYAINRSEKMVAYPDLINAAGPDFREHLYSPMTLCDQTMVPPIDKHESCKLESDPLNVCNPLVPLTLDDVRRVVDGDDLIDRVVFHLDELIIQEKSGGARNSGGVLSNSDEPLLDKFDADLGHLEFESRFESGNLRKVIQVRHAEYDLILSPDLNTRSHIQWFYFRVSNIDNAIRYRFNIINLEKPGSQYNKGMQPVVFSVKEAMNGRPYWYRAGGCIKYYKNHFIRSEITSTYHYPYTHSRLLADLTSWQLRAKEIDTPPTHSKLYFRVQNLTSTLLDNLVPLVTITEADNGSTDPGIDSARPYIFITARVHPGETNSSWVMRGLLDRLTDPQDHEMSRLRRSYVFKIVPLLNPDGVICGNHRCSMSAVDLNRQWLSPSKNLHPTIFHTKCLINLLSEIGSSPFIYIDQHGHSRMKDIFVYGCDPRLSWNSSDALDLTDSDTCFLDLAEVMYDISPPFSKRASDYSVSRSKEATGRVVVWRQFGVARSYTLESSYCGTTRNCWKGDTGGHQISPTILQDVGTALCKAFALLDPNGKINGPF
ncbi:unnamed protein product [Hymenolepis diminuta]|uniref:Uncharacterized protein n=1 Tax=Hymenolepis diminuta TaxID=6216 RepID=A0A3P7BJ01_HYMDI|nr:unnamed protein product [Hymenolepis diminuta]